MKYFSGTPLSCEELDAIAQEMVDTYGEGARDVVNSHGDDAGDVRKALPSFCPVPLQQSLPQQLATQALGGPFLNRPSVKILDPAGAVRWTRGLEPEVASGFQDQLPETRRLAVIGMDAQPVTRIR